MSDIHVGELGITRLRQLAKVLELPGYSGSAYKDPEALRTYIESVLTKKGHVRVAYLRKINKTRDEINIQASTIIRLVKERRDAKKKSGVKHSSVQFCEQKLRDSASKLDKCIRELESLKQSGSCIDAVYPAELITAVREFIGGDAPKEDRDLFRSLLERAKQLEIQTHSDSHQECKKLKADAIRSLEELKLINDEIQKKNITLTNQIQALATRHQEEDTKRIASLIAQKTAEIESLQSRALSLESQLLTVRDVLAEYEAKKGKDIDESKFVLELAALQHQLQTSQEINKQQGELLGRLKDENKTLSDQLEESSMKLQQCNSAQTACKEATGQLLEQIRDSDRIIKDLQARLSESSKDKATLAKVRQLLSTVTKSRNQCQSSLKELEKAKVRLESGQESYSTTIAFLQSTVMKCDKDAKIFNQVHSETIRQLASVQRELKQCSDDKKQLLKTGQQLKKKYDTCNASIQEIESLRLALKQAQRDKDEAIQKEKSKVEKLQSTLAAAAKERLHSF